MDYFKQLLESYEKLKKRKLKLLESEDPISIAQREFKAAQSQNPPPSTSNPYITQGVRAKVSIFQTAKGWKFAPVAGDGRPDIRKSKFLDQEFNTFAGYFSEDQVDGSANKAMQGANPGETIQGFEDFTGHGSDLDPLVEVFQELANIADSVYSNLPADLIEGKTWGSPALFRNYIFGAKKQSLESQLLNNKIKIDYNPDTNEYITSNAPPNIDNIKTTAENLRFIISTLSKDNISEDDKIRLNNTFLVNSDNSVSVLNDTDNSGLVFKDDNGFLKMIASAISKKYRVGIRTLDIKRTISTGFDNAVRGVALEEILPILSMKSKAIQMEAMNHPGAKVLNKAMQGMFSIVKDKLTQMMQTYQSWVKNHEESALEPEEVDIINSFKPLFDENGNKLISSMVKASRDAIILRKPDFIVTKGRETGEGRRQDTFEVYSDFNNAKLALNKMGYSDEDITLKGMIKTVPVEEAFKGREDMLGPVLKSGIFRKGQRVFYNPVSLKNYISLDDAVFGTTTVGSNNDFINGVSKDPSNMFFKKAQECIGFTNTDHAKVIDYNNQLLDIGGKIRSLEVAVKARSGATGKLVNSSPFKSVINSTLDILKNSSTFSELYDPMNPNPAKRELALLLERHKKSTDSEEDLGNKIKQHLATYLKNKKIISDVAAGKKEAIHFLAMKMFNTGASVDDGMTCDYRGLETGENYNFLQNDVASQVIQSFVNKTGEWKLAAAGNNFTFVNTRNPKMKVQLIDKVEKRSGLSGNEYSTKSSFLINREVMKAFNKKKATSESLVENWMKIQESFLKSFLNKEVTIA